MGKEQVVFTRGDKNGSIDELIEWLKYAKEKGATHYSMDWSHDPMWAFKWFRTYRIKSEEEIKQEKIDALKQELKNLEG